ncbi:hypothetical protein F5Y09DRAFT_353874 [Xylaria sp. FL1042]|nr:hypothetical protein F5Y09DRAFT_353874 [Xylaria sp. FL1042]
MLLLLPLIHFIALPLAAITQANIEIHPITEVNTINKTGYFSGTTAKYLECDNSLQPRCASLHSNKYTSGEKLLNLKPKGTYICGAAGIHPFQSGSDDNRTWDAVATLHVQDTPDCDGITGWSIIVHAQPEDPSAVDLPPTSWVGDQLLIGPFLESKDASYDGKYFRAPGGQLYLLYSKQQSPKPKKRDGVVAWPMDDPQTIVPGSKPTFLLVPDDNLNLENYVNSDSFKLIETGNIRAINAYFSKTYKNPSPQYYRKVIKSNPDHLWDTKSKEVYYHLQSDKKHHGWHYIGDQVLAPGVPTVASIGPDHGWVLTFAGYNPDDAPTKPSSDHFVGHNRRPYFINLDVNISENTSEEEATDKELQNQITPIHGK